MDTLRAHIEEHAQWDRHQFLACRGVEIDPKDVGLFPGEIGPETIVAADHVVDLPADAVLVAKLPHEEGLDGFKVVRRSLVPGGVVVTAVKLG
ncbi:hypothetical protein [Methylocaldum sp.]|uniref:hypothetical protein n=1 Tax=Methylocaldum sp. TaxID=1969727 RepID=UPI002D487F81|nr:hypothetical protein [Methylocaldum sp.]HYE38235.1 hypothetical protein [Methylocaldum sp.]